MDEKIYNIFFSSTISDEKEIIRQILKEKFTKKKNTNPILSEFPDSFPKPPDPYKDSFQASIEAVNYCEIIVVIINKNYGNIKPGTEISITEAEYDEAVRLKKPRIVFIENCVWHDYKHFQAFTSKESRELFLDVLRKRGYDNPYKLMRFISKIVKLRIGKEIDNWRWIYNSNDINRLMNDIEAQINYYIENLEQKGMPNSHDIENYKLNLIYSKEIEDLQNEIKNVKEKNDNIVGIIKEAISAMQNIVESLPNINGDDKLRSLMNLEDRLDKIHFFLNYFRNLSYHQWEGPISTQYSVNLGDVFLSGGEVEVLFNCANCGKTLRAGGVEVPVPIMHADIVHNSRTRGESYNISCDCGVEYEIVADSSYADWDINFESSTKPEEFYYRILFDREIQANLDEILDENEF